MTIAALFFVTVFVASNVNTGIAVSTWDSWGVVALLLVLTPLASVYARHRRLLKLNPPTLATYTLSSDAFKETTDKQDLTLKWSNFLKVVETHKDIVLYMEAGLKLTHQGVLPESVQVAGNARTWVWRRRDVTFQLDARAVFYRELASILGAGLPLSQALALLMDAPEMGGERALIAGIRDRVSEGMSMAQAVGQASTRVTTFEQALLETGERAGQLDEVLNRLAGFLEEERALRDRLVTASIYPAIILILSALVGYGMLTFMLPAFRELLQESGLDLPFITRALLRAGTFLTYAFPLMVLLGVALVLGWRNRWRKDTSFRVQWDRRSYKWPGYGSFYALLVNVRFTRTLALLLQSGVPLLEAMSQSGRASGSPWVAARVDKEAEQVRQGDKLSDALARVTPLANTLPGWIRAGEASGDLTGMLNQAALRSQQVWDRRVTRTMTTIESALVILVGLAVFVLALSIILPILSLNQALQ